MAEVAVRKGRGSILLVCEALVISEPCYRYQAKNNGENGFIADWLLRLTTTHRTWGFGLCFLYLRNVKGYGYNHKRVYRIYRELELNLRIKPKRRLKRDKPEPLAVPCEINDTWSMDFMHDRLDDGWSFRTFNVIDDYNRVAGKTQDDPLRQRARVCQPDLEGLGRQTKNKITIYSAREPSAECLCRAV